MQSTCPGEKLDTGKKFKQKIKETPKSKKKYLVVKYAVDLLGGEVGHGETLGKALRVHSLECPPAFRFRLQGLRFRV
jgi:hypothetical protein